jgi:hypothetical protein
VVAGCSMLTSPELPWYRVARHPLLADRHRLLARRYTVLVRYPVPHGYPVLAENRAPARLKLLVGLRMVPDPDALADPDCTGAQDAPKLARSRHIEALT